MKYRVEIVVDHKNKSTQTFVWKGTTIVEHKTITEPLGDTKFNRDAILKAFLANKGSDDEN